MTKSELILFNIGNCRKTLKEYKESLKGAKKVEGAAILNALIIPLDRDLENIEKWLTTPDGDSNE